MLVFIKNFVTFISPTLTQLNISISNVIGITWEIGGQGGRGTNFPSILILPKNSIFLLLSLIGASKMDFLNDYFGCVKEEKNDKPVFERNLP
jgi:hypothetical protein